MTQKQALERSLTFPQVVVAGIGMTIGAGVFAVLGVAAGDAGNAVWLAFLIAGFCAILTGLSYAELASMFPRAGAEFDYVSHAFGRRSGVIIGCVVIVACIIGSSTIIVSCASYASQVLGLSPAIIAICLLPIFLFILLREVKSLARFVIILTFVETGCLLLLTLCSVPYFGTNSAFETPYGFSGVLSSAAMVFIAFSGFEGIVKLSEETLEPEKSIPRGLFVALLFVTILYTATAYGSISVVGWEALSESATPVSFVFQHILNHNTVPAVSTAIALGTANSAIMVLYSASRVLYGMAEEGVFPKVFSDLSRKSRVPVKAIILVVACAVPFTMLGDLSSLASLTSLFFIFSYIAINLSVMKLRMKDPGRLRPFRIPVSFMRIPVTACLGLIVSILLMLLLPPGIIVFGIICLCIISGLALVAGRDVTFRKKHT